LFDRSRLRFGKSHFPCRTGGDRQVRQETKLSWSDLSDNPQLESRLEVVIPPYRGSWYPVGHCYHWTALIFSRPIHVGLSYNGSTPKMDAL
jgi:hypothetical protein